MLAKIDANEEKNKELASQYEVQGFPTIKILRNQGKISQEYKGPREADGIVDYLKKQVGPASAEIKSTEDASNLIGDNSIFIVSSYLSIPLLSSYFSPNRHPTGLILFSCVPF